MHCWGMGHGARACNVCNSKLEHLQDMHFVIKTTQQRTAKLHWKLNSNEQLSNSTSSSNSELKLNLASWQFEQIATSVAN
jgi:hypothetical protein